MIVWKTRKWIIIVVICFTAYLNHLRQVQRMYFVYKVEMRGNVDKTKSDIAEPQELKGMKSINLDGRWETAQR
jgi:hypothetical protein